MSALLHETVFEKTEKISKFLPFIESLQVIHPNGSFPLVEDPLVTKKATLIGMFVLRPGQSTKFSGDLLDSDGFPDSIYHRELDWVYNVRGLDGGWIIANANSVDAYRLALQYGASDAVIAGSNAVSIEGTASEHSEGYLWQAYTLGEWNQLKSVDADIAEKIAAQRQEWQRLGYLSARKYPAVVIYTRSGKAYPGSKDFLEARVFSASHPDGSPHEIYILTSEAGAACVRERAHQFGLQDRVEAMLVVVPPTAAGGDIDIAQIPHILHDRLGMKVVNHDGGQSVLRDFCRAGALSQMNITLCRHASQLQVLQTSPKVDDGCRQELVDSFGERIQHFFSCPAEEGEDCGGSGGVSRAVPRGLQPVYVISDRRDDVAVVTFDTRLGFDFCSA